MRTLTFKYQTNLRGHTKESMRKAISGEPQVFDDIIFFNDIAMVDSFINPMKAKIMRAIKKQRPQSIYELAKFLDKDQGYVQREIKFLEGLGIITIEQIQENGRTKSIPKLVYDKFMIDLGLEDSELDTVVNF